jgi:hypothetical protein
LTSLTGHLVGGRSERPVDGKQGDLLVAPIKRANRPYVQTVIKHSSRLRWRW